MWLTLFVLVLVAPWPSLSRQEDCGEWPKLAPEWTIRVPDQAVTPDQSRTVCGPAGCVLKPSKDPQPPPAKQPTHADDASGDCSDGDCGLYKRGPLGLFRWRVR